jgi:hypothetical protein
MSWDKNLLEACRIVDEIHPFIESTKRKYVKETDSFMTQVKDYQERLYISTGFRISFSEAKRRVSRLKRDSEVRKNQRTKLVDSNRRTRTLPKESDSDFETDNETDSVDFRRRIVKALPEDFDSDSETVIIEDSE